MNAHSEFAIVGFERALIIAKLAVRCGWRAAL